MECKRHGKNWTVTEMNQLQREYELLGLSIQDIALKHQRNVKAIAYKLYNEGLVDSLPQVTQMAQVKTEILEDNNLTTRTSRRLQMRTGARTRNIIVNNELNLVSDDVSVVSSEKEVTQLKMRIMELEKRIRNLYSSSNQCDDSVSSSPRRVLRSGVFF